jgi:hypothetical protein
MLTLSSGEVADTVGSTQAFFRQQCERFRIRNETLQGNDSGCWTGNTVETVDPEETENLDSDTESALVTLAG